MHIWTALAVRETALLAILLLLGAGPTSFLSDRFDAGSRIALAPLLGFCLGTCVTTTVLQLEPTNGTYWILVPLALGSAGVAAVRTRRIRDAPGWRERLPIRDIAALVLVGLAVAGPINYVLHGRHTVGPAAYTFTDVDNYVGVQDGARTVSLHDARRAWRQFEHTGVRFGNFTQLIWSFFADAGSNLDATPLDSNVNALLGLGATDTFAPFLTVLLLAGALGAFAAVRYFSRSRTWTAALAGCLFGGPFFLELWFDSYQAAIVAIGLVMPFLVLSDDGLSGRRRPDLVLIALLVATMLTVYPLYIALLVGAAALMLGWHALTIRRAGGALRQLVRPLGLSIVAITAMAIALDPVGFIRDLRYYQAVLNGTLGLPRVGYHLPLADLPGWFAQTQEFWNMPPLQSASLQQIALGGLLPLVFMGLVVPGLRRYRSAWALVGLGVVCAVVAEYSYASRQACTYCAERNLLPLGAISAVLVALGLCGLLASSTRWRRVAAIVGAALLVGTVAERTRIELMRFANGSYFLDSANRGLLSALPRGGGSIEEEGFNAIPYAQAEQPLVYHLINERAPGRVSIAIGSDLSNAIAYLNFGQVLPPGPEFNPHYRYVLTRLAAIATDRRVIGLSDGIALEERVKSLDITPYQGVGAPLVRIARDGVAWVQTQYPLQLYVVGNNGRRPAWARLTFRSSRPVTVPRQLGVRTRFAGSTLTACVRATGSEPIRRVTLTINAILSPGVPPPGPFPPAMPLEGLALTAMWAKTGSCTL